MIRIQIIIIILLLLLVIIIMIMIIKSMFYFGKTAKIKSCIRAKKPHACIRKTRNEIK